MWEDKEFVYKGHQCTITHDFEEDCVKAWHTVILPDGSKVVADITPYDSRQKTVQLWIDAGYPKRIGVGPLHREDLEDMIKCRTSEK